MIGSTIYFKNQPRIIAGSSIVGKNEKAGPLGKYFKAFMNVDREGKTFEITESNMQIRALNDAINIAKLEESDIDILLAGDLINEITCSNFCARKMNIPYMGLYNACATFGEALILGASLIDNGGATNIACMTSSSFSAVEKQYRFPLEMGTQPTTTSQWTVTGAGCSIISNAGKGFSIDCATIGKVIDFGEIDASNMGSAMAPAAINTLIQHLEDTKRTFDYYDMVFTGDLGRLGRRIFIEILYSEGIKVGESYNDCGAIIFDDYNKRSQGGSGAGCCSSVFNSYILRIMNQHKYNKLLLIPTGALLSKMSSLQGESIPCIAHAISFVRCE